MGRKITECSTPYGISYRITVGEQPHRRGLRSVLNALRHLI